MFMFSDKHRIWAILISALASARVMRLMNLKIDKNALFVAKQTSKLY